MDYPGSGSENSALTAGTGYLAAGRGNSAARGGRMDWLRPQGNRRRSSKRLTLQLVQLVVTQINRRLKGQTRGRRERSSRSTLHTEINIGIENISNLKSSAWFSAWFFVIFELNQIIYIPLICVTFANSDFDLNDWQ